MMASPIILRSLVAIVIVLLVKKPFISSDSVCFDYYHGIIDDTGVTYAYESLYMLQTSKVICLKPKLALHLLLLLSGDIESCPGPLSNGSLTRHEFKQKLSEKGIKMGHQNIRGLEAHFDSFEEFLKSHDELDIIGLSETHLSDNHINDHLDIEGYSFVKRNRPKGLGGGVGIYIKNGISYKRRTDLEQDSVENIYIEISIKKSKPFIFGCFYRPPDSSKHLSKNFNELLNENIERISKEKKEIIIMGDFNINYETHINSRLHHDFKDIMTFHGFKQIVTTPTRITKDTATLIDHIFITRPSNFPSSSVVTTCISDHDFVYCRRKINTTKFAFRIIQCRNYCRYNPVNLRNDVRDIDWTPVYENNTDVNSAVTYLTTELREIFNRHAPLIEKRIRGKPSDWIDDNIKKEMNKRDRLLRKARGNKSEASWAEYRRQRNKCNNLVKRAKCTHYRNILNEEENVNPKKFWKTIKSLFPTKSKSTESGTVPVSDRVQRFSEYFSTIVRQMKSINFPLKDSIWYYSRKQPLRTKNIFKFSYITPGYVLKHLNRLKRSKATGIDLLPPNMLKDCSEEIAGPLAHIINLSLSTSTVPTLWKSAKVNPIFKSGNPDLVENYRPISILPILSKLLERTVHDQLYSYLENNNLLSDCQFGFRKRRSTKLAATLLCDSVRKSFEDGLLVGCLFLDLSKAFDTMGHSIILEKLILHGVLGPELSWVTDYLFNRTQTVNINNHSSTKETITSGVPQGSILGPLLFIVFFNDLNDFICQSQVIQYADDTVIFFGAKSVTAIETALNSDLKAIARYCEENELLLNFKKGKTEAMLLGTAQRMKRHGHELKIVHNNTIVNTVTQYCYLGNVIDQHLTLSGNFDRSYKKTASRLRLLSSVRKYLTTKASKIVYDLMILPLLTYSSTIKTSYNRSQSSKLESLERRAAKIIGINSVKSTKAVVEKHICSLVKQCLKKEIQHDVFDNYFDVLDHTEGTRNNKRSLKLPSIKLETSRPSFYFGAAKIFNELDISEREFLAT